jgi:hypothetical protein
VLEHATPGWKQTQRFDEQGRETETEFLYHRALPRLNSVFEHPQMREGERKTGN